MNRLLKMLLACALLVHAVGGCAIHKCSACTSHEIDSYASHDHATAAEDQFPAPHPCEECDCHSQCQWLNTPICQVNIDRMTLVATLAVVDQVGRLGHPSARGAASFVGQPLPALGLRTHLSLSILLV